MTHQTSTATMSCVNSQLIRREETKSDRPCAFPSSFHLTKKVKRTEELSKDGDEFGSRHRPIERETRERERETDAAKPTSSPFTRSFGRSCPYPLAQTSPPRSRDQPSLFGPVLPPCLPHSHSSLSLDIQPSMVPSRQPFTASLIYQFGRDRHSE